MARFEIVTPLKGAVLTVQTKRLLLSVFKPSAAKEVTDYLVRNRAYHKPFQQVHSNRYFTVSEQRDYLRSDLRQYQNNTQVGFWISKLEDPYRIIGRLSFYGMMGGCMNSTFRAMSDMLPSGFDLFAPYFRSPFIGHPIAASWHLI